MAWTSNPYPSVLAGPHRTTDPLCRHHRRPANWWQRRKFDRARGRVCSPCHAWREWSVIPPEASAR